MYQLSFKWQSIYLAIYFANRSFCFYQMGNYMPVPASDPLSSISQVSFMSFMVGGGGK